VRAGWEVAELASVCDLFTDGNWIESKDQADEGIRLVQTGNVGLGQFKDRGDKARYIDEATFKRLKCLEVLPGDCLISRLPDPVGRACRIPITGDKMITAVDCTVLRVDEKRLDPNFFIYYSQSKRYLSDVAALCSGTTRSRISRSNLGVTAIPLPPLDEQKRIVAVLDAAFEGLSRSRENTETNLQNARLLFLRSIETEFEVLAETRPRRTVGEIAVIKGGKRLPKGEKTVTTKTEFPYISIKDFNDQGSVNLSGIDYLQPATREAIKNYIIRSEDLYISIAGTIGKTGIVPQELDGANLTENAARMVFKEDVNNAYVYFFTLTTDFQDQAGLNTRTAAQPKLALERLKTISVPIVPPNEQIEMAVKFREVRDQTQRAESLYRAKLADLDDLRQSLLQKAFAGELT
jgi:type I restriction enzyme, S subunit